MPHYHVLCQTRRRDPASDVTAIESFMLGFDMKDTGRAELLHRLRSAAHSGEVVEDPPSKDIIILLPQGGSASDVCRAVEEMCKEMATEKPGPKTLGCQKCGQSAPNRAVG